MPTINIKCSVDNCQGVVTYTPPAGRETDVIVMAITKNIISSSTLSKKEFGEAVEKMMADISIKTDSTETTWLTCTGEPSHSRPYEIPV